MSNPATITVEATATAAAPPDIARIRLFTFAEDPAPGPEDPAPGAAGRAAHTVWPPD